MPLELQVSHVATPADMADVLQAQCGIEVSDDLLKATEVSMTMDYVPQHSFQFILSDPTVCSGMCYHD